MFFHHTFLTPQPTKAYSLIFTYYFVFKVHSIGFVILFYSQFRMAATLKPYLNCVRSSLTAALCIQNFDSQVKFFINVYFLYRYLRPIDNQNEKNLNLKLISKECQFYLENLTMQTIV